jgi:hypothetical protein
MRSFAQLHECVCLVVKSIHQGRENANMVKTLWVDYVTPFVDES